ncbi:MAG: pyridine nucleotide-disulfide oxidoreductase [Acidimicrobiaceae bacterium]|nr:pyridine nucleotide-disulfide oxidoreductase [Acidimicrobiaceae bacterium]
MSTPDPFDLIVIGAGMAGSAAAEKCARAGWRVAIVDDLPYGGTCALRGCDPKKILRRGAEIVDAAHLLTGKGIDPAGLAIDWPALSAHMHGFTDPVPTNMETSLARHDVVTLHGTARFTDADRLDIDGTIHRFRHALIATGARPRPLDFPGAEHLIDSTGFLYLEQLPERILFVGGGFISFEFAHIAARAGTKAVIADHGPRPLRGFDPDLVELLVTRSNTVGIDIHRTTEIVNVRPTGDGFDVTLDDHGHETTITTDLVVHGAGRRPDLARLDLDTADIAHGPHGVHVAGHLRSTTNPRIYAAGDAADTPGAPLTPVAVFEGKVAASNMLKDATTTPDYAGVATAVFTIPELARVGLLEGEARDAGIDLDVRYTDTSGWYSNYRIGETTAAAKILIDRTTDTIVGAHMLGPDYGELINICALAIKLGLTTRQLTSMSAAYPTVGSDLGSML